MNNVTPTADVTVGRENYIGASEAHHVLSLEPYGCQLRLFLEKCGIGYDPGEEGISKAMAERGNMLEPIAAEVLRGDTGISISEMEDFGGSSGRDWLVAHADRRVAAPESALEWEVMTGALRAGPCCPQEMPEEDGLSEIKTCNQYVFAQVLKEGPKPFHLMQVQHQLIALGMKWGILFYLHPDSFKRIGWIIGIDESIREAYLHKGDSLWKIIQAGKANLSPSDSPDRWAEFGIKRLPAKSLQCQKCPYRVSCQGEALMEILEIPQVDGVVDMSQELRWGRRFREYVKLRDIKKQAEEAMDEQRSIMEGLLGDNRHAATGPGGRVVWRPNKPRESIDGKRIVKELLEVAVCADKADEPELAGELRKIAGYKKTAKASRPFNIYPV